MIESLDPEQQIQQCLLQSATLGTGKNAARMTFLLPIFSSFECEGAELC